MTHAKDRHEIVLPQAGEDSAHSDLDAALGRRTSFSVHVAASAAPSDLPRVTAAIYALKLAGFVVTCTWPEVVAKVGNANPRNATFVQRRTWSSTDLDEIDAADAVWFLVPEPPSTTRGAWFEAGYAYAEGKHLLFSGDTKQSIFCSLGLEFDSDGGAFSHLHRLRIEKGLTELCDAAQVVGEGG